MKRFVLEMLGVVVLGSGLALAQTASSPLQVWMINPYGQVDGAILRDGRAIYFASDMSQTVMAAVHIGDAVRIDVEGGRRFLVDERNDSRVDLTPVARGGGPSAVPAMQRLTARGAIASFLRTPQGQLGGFILATGEHVRIPGSLGQRLASLRAGDMVTVEGLGTRGPWGTGMQALAVSDARGATILRR